MNIEPSWSSQAEHSIFVTPEGDYFTWGNNVDGALGTCDKERRDSPVPLKFPEGEGRRSAEIESLACGQRHCLALMKDGRVFGWGRGAALQLGEGPRADVLEPTLLRLPEPPVFVAAGSHFSAVITRGGNLYMGGTNSNSELGEEEGKGFKVFPTRVLGLPPIVEVSGGWNHTVVRTEEGEIWSWGKSDNGETGHGSGIKTISVPTLLPPFPEKIVKISCGGYHTLFLGEKGTLWSCGWNYYGNSGHTGVTYVHRPTELKVGEGGGRVKEIAAGWCNSMVLLEDGSVWVWGNNTEGQVGLGNTRSQFGPARLVIPLKVGEGGGRGRGEVVGIGCCCDHSFVVTNTGDLWLWGRGIFGTLGNGERTDRSVPRKLEGLKVKLPRPRSGKWWGEVGLWLFLGREDRGSRFSGMPLEIVFHFVNLAFGG
jgi:alpha-tubulin suppressor-like RCC1 family protein